MIPRVQHYDTPWRILVRSKSDASKVYLCDLEPYGGNGECDCEDFQIRHRPKLESGAVRLSRCKHLTEASAEFNQWIIQQLQAAQNP